MTLLPARIITQEQRSSLAKYFFPPCPVPPKDLNAKDNPNGKDIGGIYNNPPVNSDIKVPSSLPVPPQSPIYSIP
jgi:hypothetical protein